MAVTNDARGGAITKAGGLRPALREGGSGSLSAKKVPPVRALLLVGSFVFNILIVIAA